MLLPTIKPVYSGSYATRYVKIKKQCKMQAHEVPETMQGNSKFDPVLSNSSFHEDICRYRGKGSRVLNMCWCTVVSFTAASLCLSERGSTEPVWKLLRIFFFSFCEFKSGSYAVQLVRQSLYRLSHSDSQTIINGKCEGTITREWYAVAKF
jgi:hypothetical protein